MNTSIKYLKDETGNIISPVTSTSSIYDTNNKQLGDMKTYILNLVYPVGSIYYSTSSTSPATLFGGTWEQIKDRFLLSAGTTYKAGNTGGEAEHTLVVNEIPSHNHQQYATANPNTGGTGIRGTFNGAEGSGFSSYPTGSSTGNMGNSQPHNNMPPYIVVYVWKRTK